jgi:hypothetical protein
MHVEPQFIAKLTFHFREHAAGGRRRWFMFDESLSRRVPMHMDGVDGLATVGMWIDRAATFRSGETAVVRCRVIAPEVFAPIVKPGVRFELWDGGFFADGEVLERCAAGWPEGV